MTRVQMAIVGACFGVLFAVGSVARGDVAPGIVGGALGGLLLYLVLQRVQEHNDALRRRRAQRDEDARKSGTPQRVD